MKNTIKLLTVATSLVFSFSINTANAAIIDAGNLTVGDLFENPFNIPSSNNDGPDYFDTINFSLLSTFSVNIFANNLPLGFSFSRIDLLDVNGPPAFSFIDQDTTAPFSFTNVLGAGDYQVNFKYAIQTPPGGSYLGGISVAAVPEPETYAMLLAGLGLIGFSARRRKANTATV